MSLTRGKGNRTFAGNAKRPPKVRGGVANDLYPDKPRSAVMPAPTTDTRQPRLSRPGATTSPSNTIRSGAGAQIPSPRPQGGTPRGTPSKTPRP